MSLGDFRRSLEGCGGLLWISSSSLGASVRSKGASEKALLGLQVDHLELLEGHMGPPGSHLRPLGGHFGPPAGHLGPLVGHLWFEGGHSGLPRSHFGL